MTNESETGREFWISKHLKFGTSGFGPYFEAYECVLVDYAKKSCIHVIEFSEYQRVKEKLDKAIAALEISLKRFIEIEHTSWSNGKGYELQKEMDAITDIIPGTRE